MELYSKSRIEGSFKGWTGRGTYELVNGQIWVQTNYKYKYSHSFQPLTQIWKDGSRFFLGVEGMKDKIEVRRTPTDYQSSHIN